MLLKWSMNISGSQDGLVKHAYTWNIQYVMKISHLEVEILTIQHIIYHTPVGICQTGALMKSSLDRDEWLMKDLPL